MKRSPTHALAVLAFACFGMSSCSNGSTPAAPPQSLVTGTAASPARTAADVAVNRVSETPASAAAFVDSIGVNVHFSDPGSIYGQQSGNAIAQLTASGIRHYRDVALFHDQPQCDLYARLGANGVKLDMIVNVNTAPDLGPWYQQCVGGNVDAVEGPSEYDNSGDAAWPTTLRTFQSRLYAFAHGAGPVTVVAPDLIGSSDYATLGNLQGAADVGNMHDYFAGRNPGTGGWGGNYSFGTYGSLTYNMNIALQDVPGMALWSTETGYSDNGDQNPVPPAIKAKYTLRTLLVHWNAGVHRTYLYELYDEGSPPFAHYGLIDGGGTPKPVYTAIKNFITLLADNGSTSPAPYAYGIGGNVQHLLVQKQDGSLRLIVWVEAQEWDPDRQSPIGVNAEPVTVTLPNAPRSVSATTFNDDGTTTAATVAQSGATLNLSATGWPTVISINP